ncbi:MAG: amidohydrolase family protein [Verrucomicrobiota bacterium]
MLTRRKFLATSSAAAITSALPATAADLKTGWIDAHSHIWTPDTKSYPINSAYKKENMKPASFTPEQLFTHCQPVGVTRIVLIQMSFYKYDNSYMIDMIKKYPGVFSGVAVIDQDAPDIEKTMQTLSQQGVRGYRLRAGKKEAVEAWVKSPGMRTMWKYAADNGLAMCPLSNPEALPAIAAMCKEFPKTPVVIDHFSRIGASGTIEKSDLDQLCRLADFENTHVKASAFYAFGKKAAPYTDLGPMILRLRDTFGANRIMWASDCPYQVVRGHHYADAIDLIKKRLDDSLSSEDKNWILRDTAAKVFFNG